MTNDLFVRAHTARIEESDVAAMLAERDACITALEDKLARLRRG
jgi:hypothetical protein